MWGEGVYKDVRDWMVRCVAVRLVLGVTAIVVAITLAFAFGVSVDAYSTEQLWMVNLLILALLALAAVLAFGAGRNYERVRTARGRRAYSFSDPNWSPTPAELQEVFDALDAHSVAVPTRLRRVILRQQQPELMSTVALEEEIATLNDGKPLADDRYTRWMALESELKQRSR